MSDHKTRLGDILDKLCDLQDELEQYRNVHQEVAEAFHMVGYACSHLTDYLDPEGPLYQIVADHSTNKWFLVELRINPDTNEEEAVPLPEQYATHDEAVAAGIALARQDLDNVAEDND